MATVQITGSPSSFNLTSTWICNASGVITSGPTTATKTVSFAVSLPSGSTITSAYVHSEWGSPKGGFAIKTVNGTYVSSSNNNNVSVSVGTTNGTVSYEFKFKSNGVSGQAGGQASGITAVSNVYLMIEYTIPYTACTAPTSVSLSNNNVAPGTNVTLSWSGAGVGTNNAITGYHIYRASSASGTYSHTYSVTTTATSGSVTVTAPTVDGSSYYFKVYTVGTVSGYNSVASSYAVLTCSFSAPAAPTSITINGTSSVAIAETDTAILAWSGGGSGTNNPMIGYRVYIDGALYSSVGVDVSSLSIAAFSAGNHTLTIRTAGTYSDSVDSDAVYCLVAADIAAPDICLLDGTLRHHPVALYWSGAIDGENNVVTGYEVQRCESADGKIWGDWETIASQTQSTLSVSPPETYGNYYWYRVKACGAICDSDWKNCTHTLRRDHQPIEAYTDASLVVGETYVKAVHMTEPQSNIGMLLDFYHLDEQSMTDIIAGETGLAGWTEHVEEVRSAIDFLTTYHDDWLDIPVNCPLADVMQQLRDVIDAVQKPPFMLGVGKAGAVVIALNGEPTEPVLCVGRLGTIEI